MACIEKLRILSHLATEQIASINGGHYQARNWFVEQNVSANGGGGSKMRIARLDTSLPLELQRLN